MEEINETLEPVQIAAQKSNNKIYYFFGLGILIVISLFYFYVFTAPMTQRAGIIVTIEDGSSLRSISKNLFDEKVVRSRALFEAFVILYGGEKHILPGDYLFDESLPVFEVAKRISEGDRNIAPIKVTIPEGFNVSDIAEITHLKLPSFSKEKFIKLALNDEGYLFPDTYFFFNNDHEQKVYEYMKENYKKKISKIASEIQNSGKTENQIIVMASIIEREAKGDEDRNVISGILWNRLSKNMPLQVDAAPSTYKEKGLPQKPIANPGLESIRAAIHPASSVYLYYLHGKDGEIHYARTFEEHKQNKYKYLR